MTLCETRSQAPFLLGKFVFGGRTVSAQLAFSYTYPPLHYSQSSSTYSATYQRYQEHHGWTPLTLYDTNVDPLSHTSSQRGQCFILTLHITPST